MADSKTIPTPTLAANVIGKLAATFADVWKSAHNGGTALANFCAVALAEKLPEVPAPGDVEAIVQGVAKALAWDGTKRERQNKSEARALVNQHALLPEATSAFRAGPGSGTCNYHDAVRLARALNGNGRNVEAAVAAMVPKASAKAKPETLFAKALVRFHKAITDSKRKNRAELLLVLESCAQGCSIKLA